MKKKVLIVYNIMGIGGSTTSLLSLLNTIDLNRYDIDFALANNVGELFGLLPKKLNVLEDLCPTNVTQLKKRSLRSILQYIKATYLAHRSENPQNVKGQLMTYENARLSRKISKEYDVAISFLENYPLNYVATKVKAKKKITWIHVDYKMAHFIAKYDRKYYNEFDKIVLVSDECKNSFDKSFEDLSERSVVINNILSSKTVHEMASKSDSLLVESNHCNIITVCRITFAHKGLDRVINAFVQLQKEGINHNLRWFVVGDGIDYKKMNKMVQENNLEEVVFMLGAKNNPLPYEKNMDIFLLPSRYEGKPMAVTEAQMLGIPPVVTNYASAKSQVKSGFDGYIVPNEDNAIYEALVYLIHNPGEIIKWKKNLENKNFDNDEELKKVYNLIEGM